MPGDEPSGVVVGDEIPQRAAKLFDGVEGVHPKEVLLQGADEAFRDAVALRLADEGRRALDAEEPDLALEVARHVVRAVVVAQGEPLGDAAADRAEVAQAALTDRLERLEAVAGRGGVAADALAGAVVDRDEDARLSLGQGDGLGHVGAPHHVHRGGGDGAVMRAPLRTADPVRREQPMLAHQAANAPGGGADAGVAQAGPDLAVALAVQARGEDLPADVPDQFGIGAGADRASARRTGRRRGTVRRAMAVERGAGHAPDAGDPSEAIASAHGRGEGLAHRLDLRRPKGRAVSRAAIFRSSSSLAMVTSPSLALRRSSSSSRPSRSRSFIAASAATRARSRHALRRAAVTFSSRATVSRGSPRSRRVTAASLRRAEKRRSGPAPPERAPAPAFSARADAPSGLLLRISSMRLTSGCGGIYRSRLSHQTVPHPTPAAAAAYGGGGGTRCHSQSVDSMRG